MKFILIPRRNINQIPHKGVNSTAYLQYNDKWNDYNFVTMFYLTVFDEKGVRYDIDSVKIGFEGQKIFDHTYKSLNDKLGEVFEKLPKEFFSLGGGVDYYKIISEFSEDIKQKLLIGLNDIVYNQSLILSIHKEEVFKVSLLRNTSLVTIKNQFNRVLKGGAELTPYNFKFIRDKTKKSDSLTLTFSVKPDSKPKTNIHTIIGRNGAGKTRLLNNMISSIISNNKEKGYFFDNDSNEKINDEYFSKIISVSFSAFDPFALQEVQQEEELLSKKTSYSYIGLKKNSDKSKSRDELIDEFCESLKNCIVNKSKKNRWLRAIKTLESDSNFEDINLKNIAKIEAIDKIKSLIREMSSGHAIVVLTITKLVETVEEKTLLLFDEPESHLHPPLLSAFIRALSDLLSNRNGVAIIATHSPVLLQEIPKSCVWKIIRFGKNINTFRPNIETFAENVGILTSEIFGLEVSNSGFHDLLQSSVNKGGNYEDIFNDYDKQLGLEGQFLLRSMIATRDNKKRGMSND